MPELRQEYLDILEKREWSVSGYTDDGRVELEWWSPAGEDFLVCVNVENFPDEILNYSDDFDPDEHIEMWVEARANGRQDVPGARRLAIRELHARGPEIERLYLDSKILPGELRALVMVSNCLEREFVHRQLATGQPLHMNIL